MTVNKAKKPVKHTIPEWCLECMLVKPSAEDIAAMGLYLAGKLDLLRIGNIAEIAAFVMVVHDKEGRVFPNDSMGVLSRRPASIIKRTLDIVGRDSSQELKTLLTKPKERKNDRKTNKSRFAESKRHGR